MRHGHGLVPSVETVSEEFLELEEDLVVDEAEEDGDHQALRRKNRIDKYINR